MTNYKLPFERPLNEAIQIYLKRSLILGIVISANIVGLILCLLAVSYLHLFTVLLIIALTTYISSAKVKNKTKHFLYTAYRKILKIINSQRTTHDSQLLPENKLSVDQMVSLLRRDVAEWNNWKEENQNVEVDLRGVDLSETDLRRVNLRKVDLSEADLAGVDLRRADLSRANLRGADLSRANLRGADLSRANLRGTIFKRATLSEANLNKTFLLRANLSEAYIIKANLSGANLSGAFFLKFFLIWGNLLGISVYTIFILFIFIFGSKFDNIWMIDIVQSFPFDKTTLLTLSLFSLLNIIGVSILLIKPSGILLIAINLTGCFQIISNILVNNYIAAIIMGFILIGVNLREVKFFRANLGKAKLGGTNLSQTNIIGAYVREARFSYNLGLSNRDKNNLRKRGAIIDEPSDGDTELVKNIVPSKA